jgi:ABC-type uncharacterized transport system involved in gliding motility auxiliary subunit
MELLSLYRRMNDALREENKKLRNDVRRRDIAMFLMLLVSIVVIPLVGLLK